MQPGFRGSVGERPHVSSGRDRQCQRTQQGCEGAESELERGAAQRFKAQCADLGRPEGIFTE